MARPETIEDIIGEDVEFAVVHVDHLAAHPALLKGYAEFMLTAQKAGAAVDVRYSTARFYRRPTPLELENQLRTAQARWDDGRHQYEAMAAVGHLEHGWQESAGQRWADQEGLPWPPEHDPIESFDAVISDIDKAVEEA